MINFIPLASADWLALFGRFHPLLLHLPIGLLVGLLAMESFAWWQARGSACHKAQVPPTDARKLIGWMVYLTAPLAVLTAAAGWVLSEEHHPSSLIVEVHQWLGISVASGAVLAALAHLAFMRKPSPKRLGVFRVLLVGTVLLLAPTGHLGGLMSHGENFLSKYAPSWLAPVLGPPPGLASTEPVVHEDSAPINARCPITNDPVKKKFQRTWRGKTIGFCCSGCLDDWDALPESGRDEKLSQLLLKGALVEQKDAGPKPNSHPAGHTH